ncbi:MAG: glycosyltransferase [Candidatus Levyibacteriota bacterium]|nr:MAG: glycosyltransferase [Candidatus Levybacteria bacterium]
MLKPFISVVIPSYDEMANLQKGVLDKVAHFLDKKKYSYEVIIVDDGSTDGSVVFVQEFVKENPCFKLIKNQHAGKAGAVTSGVLLASGKYILFTDMDQATPIEEVENLLPYFNEGFDIVIGSRSTKRKGSPWTRVVMARGMIILRTVFIGLTGITDTQCGFKMFKKDVAKKLFTKIQKLHNGFSQISGSNVAAGFDVELLYLAQKMKFKIKEVFVNWLYVETRRVNPLTDSIEGFFDLLRIKQNDLQGKYK